MARMLRFLAACAVLIVAVAGLWGYCNWQSVSPPANSVDESHHDSVAPHEVVQVRLSRQARENLGLISKPLEPMSYWRTIDVPGLIVDRPGVSDRGVVAPVTGVVTKIDAFPGNTVEPDSPLFTIRLVSEDLHASQLELFKATEDIEIARQQLARLSGAAASGAVPGSRIIEIENDIARLQVAVRAYTQDLRARGLTTDAIDAAAKGNFVTEVVVRAPSRAPAEATRPTSVPSSAAERDDVFTYEVQELQVQLGEQVEAGRVLCKLADHRTLLIEGRTFRDDVPDIQRAAKEGQPVEIDIGLDETDQWPPPPNNIPIDHVANTIDPGTRTFGFYLVLENQSQVYTTADGARRLLWRFRPGARLRLRVPVERLENVFVLPRDAVVREGPEAYAFRQNGDLFERRPVRVLYEDRLHVVLATDGSLRPGIYVAQNSAASLNRVLKAQANSGMPAGMHVHADGTVHEAH